MVHFPSLFVGSTFSLVSFLAIHEQLSHRSRLSSKWKLTGAMRRVLSCDTAKVVYELGLICSSILPPRFVRTEMIEQQLRGFVNQASESNASSKQASDALLWSYGTLFA
jgi:hypothetical protein